MVFGRLASTVKEEWHDKDSHSMKPSEKNVNVTPHSEKDPARGVVTVFCQGGKLHEQNRIEAQNNETLRRGIKRKVLTTKKKKKGPHPTQSKRELPHHQERIFNGGRGTVHLQKEKGRARRT